LTVRSWEGREIRGGINISEWENVSAKNYGEENKRQGENIHCPPASVVHDIKKKK
jgi:hypothetical protein